jgi:two-component system nitrogen regulation sensor histidine kinase NtrY
MAEDAPLQAPQAARRSPRWWRRTLVASRRMNLFLWLEVASAAALVVMLASSYLALSQDANSVAPLPALQSAALLVGTLIPALALLVLWGRRLAIRRAGDSSARLHVKLVFFFSLVAAVPTLLVAVFASILFQSGVEFWFSANNRGILENANRLAQGYYDQNQRSVENNTITMAGDLRYYLERDTLSNPNFPEEYTFQVLQRELSRSAILQVGDDGSVVIPAIVNPDDSDLAKEAVLAALPLLRQGEGVVTVLKQDRVEAVAPIDGDAGIYLYNARQSDVLSRDQYDRAQNVLAAYDTLTGEARDKQLQFNVALFAVSLLLVGAAVWFALRFADRQVRPLTDLVGAARQVGSGNYALRVEGRTGPDEIGLLNRAFNRMTGQIEQQTAALIGANRQLAERRAFIETVLQSITAGIVSVDRAGEVQLMNSSAQQLLLDRTGPAPLGLELKEIAPVIDALMRSGSASGLVHQSRDGELLTLAVKLAPAANGWVSRSRDAAGRGSTSCSALSTRSMASTGSACSTSTRRR